MLGLEGGVVSLGFGDCEYLYRYFICKNGLKILEFFIRKDYGLRKYFVCY